MTSQNHKFITSITNKLSFGPRNTDKNAALNDSTRTPHASDISEHETRQPDACYPRKHTPPLRLKTHPMIATF